MCVCAFHCIAEVTNQLEKYVSVSRVNAVTTSSSATTATTAQDVSSPPRRCHMLFASYERHLSNTSGAAAASTTQSAAATVLLYVYTLPALMTQARQSDKPWLLFRADQRFSVFHPLQEKMLCVPATSAAVERVFSHGVSLWDHIVHGWGLVCCLLLCLQSAAITYYYITIILWPNLCHIILWHFGGKKEPRKCIDSVATQARDDGVAVTSTETYANRLHCLEPVYYQHGIADQTIIHITEFSTGLFSQFVHQLLFVNIRRSRRRLTSPLMES